VNAQAFCALITPAGSGGINVIRLWGTGAFEAVRAMFTPESRRPLVGTAGSLRYGRLCHEGSVLDEVLIAIPEGATDDRGVSVVDVNCHGGFMAARRVLEALASRGVRCVEDRDLFCCSHLTPYADLIANEAAQALMRAATPRAARMLLAQAGGALRRYVEGLRLRLAAVAAGSNEHALTGNTAVAAEPGSGPGMRGDTSETAVPDASAVLEDVLNSLQELVDNAPGAISLVEPRRLVLVGLPNVGKSSLLNALTGSDRALVHHAAGTTRDYIEVHVAFEGVPFVLVDCAGICFHEDEIGRESVSRALAVASHADGVLLVFELPRGWTPDEELLLEHVAGKRVLFVANKSDLCGGQDERTRRVDCLPFPAVATSALTREGIGELVTGIVKFFHQPSERDSAPAIFNQRQLASARKALAALRLSWATLERRAAVCLAHLGVMLGIRR